MTANKIGRPSTLTPAIHQRIVDLINAGAYFEAACGSAGIRKETAYRWLRNGAKAGTTLEANAAADVNDDDMACLLFRNAVVEAQADWENRQTTYLEQLASGGLISTTTTVKVDGDGKVLETSTKSDVLLPDPKVIMWRLERKHPDRYGRRTAVEVTGKEGDPLEIVVSTDERVKSMLESVKRLKAAREERDEDVV